MTRPNTLRIVTRPAEEPVTLAQAKTQVGLVEDMIDFDELLERLIATARRVVEQRLGISLLPTEYRATWPAGTVVLELPGSPLLEGSAYPLTVTVGDEELTEADYEVEADAMPAAITLDASPGEKVTVTYWGGHEDVEDLEPQLRSAVLLYVDHLFENRGVIAEGGTVELPAGFEMLLASCSYSGGY